MPRAVLARGATFGLTATDPSVVFVVKSLLYPVLAVASLAVSAFAYDVAFRGPYFLLATLVFLATADLLDVVRLHSPGAGGMVASVFDLFVRWWLLAGAIWLLLVVSGFDDRFDERVLIAWAVSAPFAMLAGQAVLRLALVGLGDVIAGARRAVIVGLNEPALRLEQMLAADPAGRTQVLGFFEDRDVKDAARVPAAGRGRVLGRTRDVAHYAARNEVGAVYVSLPMTRHPRILALLDSLRDTTASIYFVPDFLLPNMMQPRFDTVGGIPLLAVRESPFYGVRSLVKRLFDIIVTVPLIVVLSPVLLVIALAIRLDSPGPVLFRQPRYGLDGKRIDMLKFRTLTVVEDGESAFTHVGRNDARMTRLGRFLRRFSFDELPQLFNVLEGSMSLVGPRPHVIAMNEKYRRLVPGYMLRHKVKPGVTGLAQVNGCRGGDDLDSMRNRVEYDLEYVQRWSVWLDLWIVLQTAVVVIRDPRAF